MCGHKNAPDSHLGMISNYITNSGERDTLRAINPARAKAKQQKDTEEKKRCFVFANAQPIAFSFASKFVSDSVPGMNVRVVVISHDVHLASSLAPCGCTDFPIVCCALVSLVIYAFCALSFAARLNLALAT